MNNISSDSTAIGLGESLRQAREARGLTLEDLCDQLKLHTAVVIALESDEYDRLPAPAYVRGYIRQYCAFVGLDQDNFVATYEQMSASDYSDPVSIHQAKSSSAKAKFSGMWWAIGLGVLLIVVLLSAIAWYVVGNQLESQVQNTDASLNIENINTDSAESTFEEQVDEAILINSESDAQQTTSSDGIQVETDEEVPTQTIKTSIESDQTNHSILNNDATVEIEQQIELLDVVSDALQIGAIGPSWIEVIDADGNQLLYKMLESSEEPLVVYGRQPFKVLLGNAPNISIQFNGEEFNHAQHIASNNSAYFSIGSQE